MLIANIWIHKEGNQQLGGHDAPDDGFAPDNGVVAENGDQQSYEEGFADELDDAGNHGQYFLTDALQGHFGLVQQTQHEVEGANHAQIAGGVADNGRVGGAGNESHQCGTEGPEDECDNGSNDKIVHIAEANGF